MLGTELAWCGSKTAVQNMATGVSARLALLCCVWGRELMLLWVQDLPLSEGTAKFLSGCLDMDGEVSHPLGCRALTAPAVCSMSEASLQQAPDPIANGGPVGKTSYDYV